VLQGTLSPLAPCEEPGWEFISGAKVPGCVSFSLLTSREPLIGTLLARCLSFSKFTKNLLRL
jgi:hypothetical protein